MRPVSLRDICHGKNDLRQNFVTTNGQICVELDAHSFTSMLLYLLDKRPDSRIYPWQLGSQACENAFRGLRSMSSTFSTVINFNVYSVCQRMARVMREQKMKLEREENGFIFPCDRYVCCSLL